MEPNNANWENCLEHAARTDVGLRRANNQDSYACVLATNEEVWRTKGHVFVVADGMGAHAAGELASKIAVDTAPHAYFKLTDENPLEAARHAVEDANRRIHTRGQANLDFRGMGTTNSMLLVLPDGALVAHVGDSRVYRLRGNQLDQLTFDHSLVWEMMAAREMVENDVPAYIPKNIITRSLGPNEQVEVDVEGPFPLQAGDTFMLCSDGLSGQIHDNEIGMILATLPPAEAVTALVDVANLRGGPDNITTIVAKVRAAPAGPPSPAFDAPAAAPSGPAPPTNPAYWALPGVFALAGTALYLSEHEVLAIVCGVAALATGAWLMLRKPAPAVVGDATAARARSSRHGRAPYRSVDSTPSIEFVEKLGQMAAQLRDVAVENKYPVQWEGFDDHERRAAAAITASDLAGAIREYCRAISSMMSDLRRTGGALRDDKEEA